MKKQTAAFGGTSFLPRLCTCRAAVREAGHEGLEGESTRGFHADEAGQHAGRAGKQDLRIKTGIEKAGEGLYASGGGRLQTARQSTRLTRLETCRRTPGEGMPVDPAVENARHSPRLMAWFRLSSDITENYTSGPAA